MLQENEKKLSIIVPVFNEKNFINKLFNELILYFNNEKVEVIIVDDIDTDKYEKQIEALKDEASRSEGDSAEKIRKSIKEREHILAAMIKAKNT